MFAWMIMPFQRYFEFSGRSRRKEFWLFALLNTLVFVGIFALRGATGGASMADIEAADAAGTLAVYSWMFSGVGILLGIWWLIVIVPGIAVTVRRLHDRDLSGWWYLGVIVGSMIPFLGVLVSLAFLIVMALPGTPGENRFGPDPKGGAPVAAVFN